MPEAKDEETVNQFVKDAIALDFPGIKITKVIKPTLIEGTLVGLVVDESTGDPIAYNFSIEQGKSPWLQRFVPSQDQLKKAGQK